MYPLYVSINFEVFRNDRVGWLGKEIGATQSNSIKYSGVYDLLMYRYRDTSNSSNCIILISISLLCRLESESTSSSGTKIRSNSQNYDVDIGKFSKTLFYLLSLCFSLRVRLTWSMGCSKWGKNILYNLSLKGTVHPP